jgi:lisH domain-containing protein FOPNL
MSSLKELKEVLKDTLEEKGILKDIRAKIRAEIFKSLQDES